MCWSPWQHSILCPKIGQRQGLTPHTFLSATQRWKGDLVPAWPLAATEVHSLPRPPTANGTEKCEWPQQDAGDSSRFYGAKPLEGDVDGDPTSKKSGSSPRDPADEHFEILSSCFSGGCLHAGDVEQHRAHLWLVSGLQQAGGALDSIGKPKFSRSELALAGNHQAQSTAVDSATSWTPFCQRFWGCALVLPPHTHTLFF